MGARTCGRKRPLSSDNGLLVAALRASDANSSHLVFEARSALEVVLDDLRELESVVTRLKAWLAVPPEFRRIQAS